jgi:hypothetical protein
VLLLLLFLVGTVAFLLAVVVVGSWEVLKLPQHQQQWQQLGPEFH